MDYEKMLTKGALKSIKNNKRVEGSIMQVIDVGKNSRINDIYLTVSDGENMNIVWISTNLNFMVDRELTKFSFIKIINYLTTNIIERAKEPRQVITFSDLIVIVPGSIISKTIGNPQPNINTIEPILRMKASAPTVQVHEECSELHTKQELWKFLIERGQYSRLLTMGALQSIMDNVMIKYPVMQVLDIKPAMNTGNCRFCLTISDGQYFYPIVLLADRLNSMITYGYLTKLSIINIRNYVIGYAKEQYSKRNRQVIILTNLVCLLVSPGAIIGDPKLAKENLGQVDDNSIPASTGAICNPIVEMNTLVPPTAQDQEVESLLLNLDMLHII